MASVTWFVTLHYEHRLTGPCPATAWRQRCLCSIPWLPAVWAPSYWPCSATAWLSRRLCLIFIGPVTSVRSTAWANFQLGSYFAGGRLGTLTGYGFATAWLEL